MDGVTCRIESLGKILFRFQFAWVRSRYWRSCLGTGPGPVSRKSQKPFTSAKRFLVHLFLETEKCIQLKFLVWRESLFILRIREKKHLCNHTVRNFAAALRVRKLIGTFEKRTPMARKWRQSHWGINKKTRNFLPNICLKKVICSKRKVYIVNNESLFST